MYVDATTAATNEDLAYNVNVQFENALALTAATATALAAAILTF
jgi:hypothetical protein